MICEPWSDVTRAQAGENGRTGLLNRFPGTEAFVSETIETEVPSRLDRLPWSKFHWLVVIGLGTVWILDGLEVTIVGSVGDRLTEAGSGISLDASQIGTAAAFYVGGACIGALFFGQLTDRLGRKKLFLFTLAFYIAATVATEVRPVSRASSRLRGGRSALRAPEEGPARSAGATPRSAGRSKMNCPRARAAKKFQ